MIRTNVIFGRVKRILLILAVSSTIIENMGGFPLYICMAYFLVSLFDFQGFANRSFFKASKDITLLWGGVFLYLTVITGLYSSSQMGSFNVFGKWIKALWFFLLVLKDTFNRPKLVSEVLICYCFTAFICAVLMLNGIGVELDLTEIGDSRLTFVGTNANKMSMVYVFSFSIALFFWDRLSNQRGKRLFFLKVLPLILFMALCLYVMGFMASRGAFVCIFVVMAYYFFFYRRTKSLVRSLLIGVVGIVVIALGIYFLSYFPVVSERMELLAEGDYGQRDVLIRAAWDVFLSHPFFGVGLIGVLNGIEDVIGAAKTPHNLYLYMLSAGGIVGFSMFMVIIYKSLLVIFKDGYKKGKLLPVILFLCILLDYAKNGGALTNSINYIMFAISLNLCGNYSQKSNNYLD